MSSPCIDFVSGPTLAEQTQERTSEHDLSLCYACPTIDDDRVASDVLASERRESRATRGGRDPSVDDGLYVVENPFTDKIVRPYRLEDARPLDYANARSPLRGKLVEIAIRDVHVRAAQDRAATATTLAINAVSVLYKGRQICRTRGPFNRKLHKLLIREPEWHDLSIQVHARGGESSVLPLPLPRSRCVQDRRMEIDFAISDQTGEVHPGVVVCTVSLSNCGTNDGEYDERCDAYLYTPSNDPNDPCNVLYASKSRGRSARAVDARKDVGYFLLQDPALTFDVPESDTPVRDAMRRSRESPKPPDVVLTEQTAFSLLDISFGELFRANRPLRPSSASARRHHHAIGKTVLSVTILRGVEVPVREESASVSPLLEVEWADAVRSTTVADGPAPVWQQTVHFESPRQNGERSVVRFRLYDQHPVWGQQWLGEARIPLERHRHYQELERWVALSPLFSPAMLFGYVQASPGQSHTRIYVLMRMERPAGDGGPEEADAIDTLSKGVQRCLAIPYKVTGIETPDDAARLAMLLAPLPLHYGPVTPRQALSVNKVDHYGRAALLATLLQGLGLQSYVLLGSSQVSRWTAFVLSVEGDDVALWDPEIGDHYKLSDSRCSLMKVSRLINYSGIWENLQKSILPHNLKYNVAIGKDWRPLVPVTTSTGSRPVQTLELSTEEDAQHEKESAAQIEQHLRDKLSGWRSALGLTTMFNRHAVTVLRGFISSIPSDARQSQLDKRDLKQLHRAYHTHGFILNLRQTTPDELAEQVAATKIHSVTGPVEFALVCHVQRYVGRIRSIWLVLAILRSRG